MAAEGPMEWEEENICIRLRPLLRYAKGRGCMEPSAVTAALGLLRPQ
jgi:hypothetical protein